MTTNQETKVLVIKTDYLQNQIGKFTGFCPVDVLADKGQKFHQIWNEMFEQQCEYISPHDVKRSRTWKRITPYFIILNNDHVLTYPAEIGTEQHNCGIHSIGIDVEIHALGNTPPSEAYFTEAIDQLAEKLSLKLDFNEINSSFVGIINDDMYEFGVEHVGFVHLIMINDDEKSSLLRSDQFSGLEFISINQLKKTIDDYEPWSRHVINLIYRPEQITPEMTVFLTEVVRLSSSIIYPSTCRLSSKSMPVNHLLD